MSKLLQKNIVTAISLLMVIAAAIVFGLLPQIRQFSRTFESLRANNTELSQAEEKLNLLIKAKNDSETIDNALNTVNNLWPDKEDVSKFIIQVEGLAAENTMAISNVAITKVSAPKKPKVDEESKDTNSTATPAPAATKQQGGIRFSFESKTEYPQALSFITGMEKLARFNTVDSINISADKTGELTLKINGYIYGQQK